jgi:DNA-binding response OmpR family regulator/HPt (histidine-containing phosphotransfer) domain-containing protein
MESLAERLIQQRYAVDIAVDGQCAQTYVDMFNYDLIVLDLMLPDGDGIEFCHQFRQAGYANPLMILTAKESIPQKVTALDAGADDYVVKPFDFDELCARIRALLRREHQGLPPILQWGPLRLDPRNCGTTYGQQSIHLTPKEFSLMELFLRHPQRIYSLSSIIDDLWSFEDPPGEDAIRTHIKGLRRKLAAAGAPKDLVKTVYGLGYRLHEHEPEAEVTHSEAHSEIDEVARDLSESTDSRATDSRATDPKTADSTATDSTATDLELPEEQANSPAPAPWSKSWHAPTATALASSRLMPTWPAYSLRGRTATGEPPLTGKIARACKHYLRTASQQIAVLEQAAVALNEGTMDSKLQHLSQMNAHKLAGSLGSFGVPNGSQIARQIETQLRARSLFTPQGAQGLPPSNLAQEPQLLIDDTTTLETADDETIDDEKALALLSAAEIAQLVHQLRQNLDGMTVQAATLAVSASVQESTPRLLIISEDTALAQQLIQAATRAHLQAEAVSAPQQAEAYFQASSRLTAQPNLLLPDLLLPDLLLLDLADVEPFLALIKSAKQDYALPIIVLEHQLTLASRLSLVQAGVEIVSDRTTSPAQIIESAIGVLKASTSQIQVAIADDDPQMLTLLKVGLEPWGFGIHTFESAIALWQWLTDTRRFAAPNGLASTAPRADILVLDVEMPEMNGIELCRVLRADARFQSLPILFLTVHQEDELRMQAFQSGADDFIDKAVAPVELATRLRNQLARACRI